MPADIENMILCRERAWHDWPVLPVEAVSAEEVLRLVPQLAAHVRTRALYWIGGGPATKARLEAAIAAGDPALIAEAAAQFVAQLNEVGSHVGNVRDAGEQFNEALVGVVTDSYKIAQTRHQFTMLDELVGAGELRYETAMSLQDGRVHAIMARLPEDIEIAGDKVAPYIGCVNSFDGSYALSWALTPVRWVCSNTLRWGMQKAEARGSVYRVSHIGNVDQRIAEARKALGFTASYLGALREKGERFSELRMDEQRQDAFLKHIAPMPTPAARKAAKDGGASLAMKAGEVREVVRSIVMTAPDLAAHRDNGWGWLNAVVEHEDHYRTGDGERRFLRVALGERKLIERADEFLTAELVAA